MVGEGLAEREDGRVEVKEKVRSRDAMGAYHEMDPTLPADLGSSYPLLIFCESFCPSWLSFWQNCPVGATWVFPVQGRVVMAAAEA